MKQDCTTVAQELDTLASALMQQCEQPDGFIAFLRSNCSIEGLEKVREKVQGKYGTVEKLVTSITPLVFSSAWEEFSRLLVSYKSIEESCEMVVYFAMTRVYLTEKGMGIKKMDADLEKLLIEKRAAAAALSSFSSTQPNAAPMQLS